MSIILDHLETASFPDDYAQILIELLAVTPANLPAIKDALYHFRRLDDEQACEAIRAIIDQAEPLEP